MARYTNEYTAAIIENVDGIVEDMRHALALHGNDVRHEVQCIASFRNTATKYYATFCAVKAILSNGMKLTLNIAAAHAVTSAMMLDPNGVYTYEDIDCIIKRAAPKCGSMSYGASVSALRDQWTMLATLTGEDMTWETLYNVKGLAEKTTSWALALWNANNRVFTLDRWMLRGISGVKNVDTINDTEYFMLADVMLNIIDEYFPNEAPLVVQWSMWNEYRHAGQHATHSDIYN